MLLILLVKNLTSQSRPGGPKVGAGYMGGGDVQLLSFEATATSSSVAHGGVPARAVDGRTDRRWGDG